LRINPVSDEDLTVTSFHGEEGNLQQYYGLFLGLEFELESATYNYLLWKLSGKQVVSVSFEEGVDLYPGGGFYVTHTFFITFDGSQAKVEYVKLSWWNS